MFTTANTEEHRYILQHLANERTVLAWFRSVIALEGVAFVLWRLFGRHHGGPDSRVHIVAIEFMLAGILATIYASLNYLKTRAEINHNAFRFRRFSFGWLFGLLIGGMILGLLTAGLTLVM